MCWIADVCSSDLRVDGGRRGGPARRLCPDPRGPARPGGAGRAAGRTGRAQQSGRARLGCDWGQGRRRVVTSSLKGKSVVVTGASKGIGKGIARVFAQAGARILVVGRDLKAAEAAAQEMVKAGGEASAISADVTKLAEMEAAAKAAADRHGGIDVLCEIGSANV